MAKKSSMTMLERAQAAAWQAIRETQEHIKKMSEENDKRRKEYEATEKKRDKVSGRLDRKFGELWELIVVPNIKEKFNELGFRFDSVARSLEFDRPDGSGRSLVEVDILLENGDYAIVVEVKDSFKKKYLEEHINRMKKLKTLPRFANKKLYGAIAAGFIKGESKQLAFEQGFYVVNRPDSVNVQIEQFPRGFKPRAW